jgi:hypothetical protein
MKGTRIIALGKLDASYLGQRVTGMPAQRTHGVPKASGPVTGWLESLHHCRVDGADYTRAIVKIVRTAEQMKNREPEYREIGGVATDEIEVPE